MEGTYINNYLLRIWNLILSEHPLCVKSCNLSPWSRYLTLCLSFLTCKVRLRNTYLIGAVMRIRGVNIAKYLTQSLVVVQLLSHVWLLTTPWTAACRLLCPSLSSGVCSKSCSLSRWCYLTISSSAAPFTFFLQRLVRAVSVIMTAVIAIYNLLLASE